MKKVISFFLLVIFINPINAQRRQTLFDEDWKFFKGNVPGAEQRNFNDENWRTVELPHDWSIEDLPDQSDSVRGPFTSASTGATATGYTVGGIGWYRKHFTLNNIQIKKYAFILMAYT